MKVDVWKNPKKTNIEFSQNAPIILKMYCCCRKRNHNKIFLRQNVVKKSNFIYYNN